MVQVLQADNATPGIADRVEERRAFGDEGHPHPEHGVPAGDTLHRSGDCLKHQRQLDNLVLVGRIILLEHRKWSRRTLNPCPVYQRHHHGIEVQWLLLRV